MVQRETQMKIPLDHDYDSPQAIYDLVDRSSGTFTDFRHGRQKWTQKLRDKIEPIALIVQTLSGPLGDAVTLVRDDIAISALPATDAFRSAVLANEGRLRRDRRCY